MGRLMILNNRYSFLGVACPGLLRPSRAWPLIRPVQAQEELRRLHRKSIHDLENVDERKIVLSSFNPAHIAAINAARIPKCLLRKPAVFPQATHVLAEANELGYLQFPGALICDHCTMVKPDRIKHHGI